MIDVLPVSVVIPTKNQPAVFRVAVERFLRQTSLPPELLFADKRNAVRAGRPSNRSKVRQQARANARQTRLRAVQATVAER